MTPRPEAAPPTESAPGPGAPGFTLEPRPFVLLALAFAFFALTTQRFPYHLDTVGYVETAKASIATGILPRPLDVRFLNAWWYLPFLWIGHDAGIRALSIALILGFTVLYERVVRREFGAPVAFAATILVLSIPATVITVTHLKEDFAGLLLVFGALALLRPDPSPVRIALAGALYGLACLSKETPLVILPFMVLHVGLVSGRPERFRDLVRASTWLRGAPRVAGFLLATAATMYLVSPRHLEYLRMTTGSLGTGQFLGFGSPAQAEGLRQWREGVLHLAPLHVLLLPVALWAWRRRSFTALLWLACAVGTGLFLSNTSVIRGRLFVITACFSAPLIATAAAGALDWTIARIARKAPPAKAVRSRSVAAETPAKSPAIAPSKPPGSGAPAALILPACALAFAALQVSAVLPTLRYRLAYPPQARFYGGLGRVLPSDALLIGLDNCRIARYYTGRPYLMAPMDADSARAEAFARTVADSLARRPVYLLPDAFSGDPRGHLERALQAVFDAGPAYTAIGEDYHAMTYGRPMRDLPAQVARTTGCQVSEVTHEPYRLEGMLSMERWRITFQCNGGRGAMDLLAYDGRQTFLLPLTVARLAPRRDADPSH